MSVQALSQHNDNVKRNAEQACSAMGLSMSTAINIYLIKLGNERRIPFEVSADPFCSKSNMARLARTIEDAKAGRNMTEHELIEE